MPPKPRSQRDLRRVSNQLSKQQNRWRKSGKMRDADGEKGDGRKWRGEVNATREPRRAGTEQRGGEPSPARHGSVNDGRRQVASDWSLNETVRVHWQTTDRSVLFSFSRVFFCGNLRPSADDQPFRGFRLRSLDRVTTPDRLECDRSAQRQKTFGPQITRIDAEKTKKPRSHSRAVDAETTTSCGRRSATHNFCWGPEKNWARR